MTLDQVMEGVKAERHGRYGAMYEAKKLEFERNLVRSELEQVPGDWWLQDGPDGKAVPKDGQGNPTLSQETVDLYILMLSLSIVDQSGALIFRSPEARQFLRDEPFDVLDHLAAAAADLNELGDTEKKGTAPVS